MQWAALVFSRIGHWLLAPPFCVVREIKVKCQEVKVSGAFWNYDMQRGDWYGEVTMTSK
jgi:hypothetical protein